MKKTFVQRNSSYNNTAIFLAKFIVNGVFEKCLLGQRIFRQTTKYRFLVQTAKNAKEKTLMLFSERSAVAIRDLKAHFARSFKFAHVQECENYELLQQKLIKYVRCQKKLDFLQLGCNLNPFCILLKKHLR